MTRMPPHEMDTSWTNERPALISRSWKLARLVTYFVSRLQRNKKQKEKVDATPASFYDGTSLEDFIKDWAFRVSKKKSNSFDVTIDYSDLDVNVDITEVVECEPRTVNTTNPVLFQTSYQNISNDTRLDEFVNDYEVNSKYCVKLDSTVKSTLGPLNEISFPNGFCGLNIVHKFSLGDPADQDFEENKKYVINKQIHTFPYHRTDVTVTSVEHEIDTDFKVDINLEGKISVKLTKKDGSTSPLEINEEISSILADFEEVSKTPKGVHLEIKGTFKCIHRGQVKLQQQQTVLQEECSGRIREVEERFGNDGKSLQKDGRILYFEGEFDKATHGKVKRWQHKHVFLFDDILVYGVPAHSGNSITKQVILSLVGATVSETKKEKGDGARNFVIKTETTELELKAKTSEVKEAWMQRIRNTRVNKQMHELACQVEEVKDVVKQNVVKLEDRGASVENLTEKGENLNKQSESFHKTTKNLKEEIRLPWYKKLWRWCLPNCCCCFQVCYKSKLCNPCCARMCSCCIDDDTRKEQYEQSMQNEMKPLKKGQRIKRGIGKGADDIKEEDIELAFKQHAESDKV